MRPGFFLLIAVVLAVAAPAGASVKVLSKDQAGNPRFWTSDRVAKTLVAKNPQFLPGTPLKVVAAVCVGHYPPAAIRDPAGSPSPASRNFHCAVQWLPADTTGRVAPKRAGLWVRPSSATAICWSAKSLAVLVANRRCGP
jgi:hypothetical protein